MAIKFDHSQDSLHLAIGIDDERSDELDAIVFFSIIDQSVLTESLFDNPDDAPINMRTKTGMMERMFEKGSTEAERIYLAMQFSKIDRDMDFESSGVHGFLAGLTMMYEAVDGDCDKFLRKFIKYKEKAKAEYEKGLCDDCRDDDDDED